MILRGVIQFGETFSLALAGDLHALLDQRGWFTQALVAQLFILHARNFDVNIDAVQQRP